MSHFTKVYHRRPYPSISPSLPSLAQTGRTVLITGGGTGIGFAISQAFTVTGAARIVIASRSESTLSHAKAQLESLVRESSTKIETCPLDLSSGSSIAAFWSSLTETGVVVDTMILNAADMSATSKLSGTDSLKQIREMYEVNVLGNWHMITAFLAQGPKLGKVLINISSVAIHWNPVLHPVYATTKAAFTHSLQALADEVPRAEVQTISLHPGAVFTRTATRNGYAADSLPWDNENLTAHFVVWASSTQAAFLHGRFVWAQWDVDELKGMKSRLEEDKELLRLSLKGVENVNPITMWDHLAEMAQADVQV